MAASDHSPVDFETFDRYESGKMSYQEQHALEKRMLEDPFVAEAYEGYLAMKAANVDAKRINTGLFDALNARVSSNRNVIPMWSYAAAASVIVILGAYWLVFFNDHENSIADNTPAMSIEIAPGETLSQKTSPLPPSPEKAISSPTISTAPATSGAATAGAATAAAASAAASSAARPKKVPARPQQIAETEKAEQTGLNEQNIDLNKQELVVAAEPAPAPVISAPAASSAPATVLADQADAPKPGLSKSSVQGAKMAAKATLANLDSAAAPVDGWHIYQPYLQKNTLLKAGNTDITVRFTVNADGSLSGFTATGNSAALFDRAIRIVKDGPAWRPASFRGTRRPSLQEVTLHFHSPQ